MQPATDNIPSILKEAIWIWPVNAHCDILNCYAQFRRPFTLKKVPKRAPLFITADQSYQLYINGKYVCRGPARGFQSHWPYDEVDVAKFLRRGKNILAVRAHNPGFSNFQYISQQWAGLLIGADWSGVKIVTSLDWKCRREAGVSKDAVPTSMQLFCQEHIDKRIEPDDWMTLNFDDSNWGPTVSSGRWNSMPWYSLEERKIPFMREEKMWAQRVLGNAKGKCADNYRDARDVARLRKSEGLEHELLAGGNPRVIRVQATGAGRFVSYLLDFGRTVVGGLSFKIEGAAGGEIIDTLHTETVDAETLAPHHKPESWCKMAFGYRLICRKGTNVHDFYHPYGFRYLTLTVRDSKHPLKIDLSLNWVGYPLTWKGSFDSSNKALTDIWQTCAWTQQCCSMDAYVDTPWREQAQWWGDARVQAWNTFHLDGDPRLFRRGIHCIASQTLPNGLTYGHAPTIAHNCILPDFTLIWLLTIWDYYWQTGSLEPLLTHEKAVDGALQYFRDQTDRKTGLAGYDARYWLFLDWTELFKEGFPSVYNLWLLITLDKLAIMYRAGRNASKAKELEAWAARLRRSLKPLINKDGLVRDGITRDGKIVPETSVHSQTLAIIAGLNPRGEQAMLDKVLLPFIREHVKPTAYPSAYWITYVFSVLAQKGHAQDVLRFIEKHWTPMVKHGTTWENFEVTPGDISSSHAWSAHPLFHLMGTVGGIQQTAAAWKEISFAPVFTGSHGGAVIPSPRGKIASSWKRRADGGVDVRLSVPKGVKARVELPGSVAAVGKGTHRWTV